MNLQLFKFKQSEVRVKLIDNEPWFLAKDVCNVLEIVNISDACSKLRDKDKLVSVEPISGQNRDVLFVSEAGLYDLVFSSRKPQAKEFKYWVFEEVLPSIRKTGKYEVKPMSTIDVIIAQAQEIKRIEEQQKAIEAKMALEAQRTDRLEDITNQHDAEIGRIFKPHGDYYTAMGYANLKNVKITLKEAQMIGKKASQYCRKLGIKIDTVKDPRFGMVNVYPEQILQQLLA